MIFWCGRPFCARLFCTCARKETGRKWSDGKVGEGPREFITGGINGSCIDNRFFAVDANGKTRGFLSLDSLSQSKDAFIPMTEEERLSRPAMAEYAKNVYIGVADAGAEHCFETLLQWSGFFVWQLSHSAGETIFRGRERI